jgi:hypothetical protein
MGGQNKWVVWADWRMNAADYSSSHEHDANKPSLDSSESNRSQGDGVLLFFSDAMSRIRH